MQCFLGVIVILALLYGAGLFYLLIKNLQWKALQRKMDAEYGWHFYQRGLDVMRRRSLKDGQWEYRAMTDQEHGEFIADRW